jgi:hypothetical protein
MKLIDRLLNLYPAAWRERYEDEFRAILQEHSLTWRDMLDIGFGALDARLSPKFSSQDVVGGLTMEGNRTLQIVGGGAVLCVLLLFTALLNRTQQGWFDAGLMILGQVVMVPVSIMLHIACRQRDVRRSNSALQITAACLVVSFVIFLLLRQQPNSNLTLGWQNIYLGGTFGLWITLNSRIAYTTGLIPHWAMSLGVVSGGLWFLMTLVMLGVQLDSSEFMWIIIVFAVAAVWLAVQLLWMGSLALSAFLPKQFRPSLAQA